MYDRAFCPSQLWAKLKKGSLEGKGFFNCISVRPNKSKTQETFYVFLSSDPNTLLEKVQFAVREDLVGYTKAYQEASAILNMFLC